MVSFKQLEFMALLEPNWQELDRLDSEYIRNLHPVFDTVLDTYDCVSKPKVTGHITLWDALQKIRYNLVQDITPEMFLTNKYEDGARNTEYDGLKVRLPAICYNASFNGHRKIANCKTINNLMFLDIDGFDSKPEALAYKSRITKKYNWILACSLSLSKSGLHVVIMVDKITDNDDFNFKYDYISTTYFNGKPDVSSKSLSRLTVVPYDHDIYINESPTALEIDIILRNNGKGIRSAYIKEDSISSTSEHEGIRSAYIEDQSTGDNPNTKGLCSGDKKEIICTAYTFSPETALREILNNAARKDGLRFRPEVDESLITDPDIPLYFHEGIDVVSINLFPYRDRKVLDGGRTIFLGSMTVQMLYLNVELPEHVHPDIRTHILKFIVSLNNKICVPPLPYKEVLNSYNANWRKYEDGKMIFSRYFKKQRAFWSANTKLKGNEKRKVTCGIKNEPIVAESRRQIREAIKTLAERGEKVTQKRVAEISEIGLSTVKKYRKYYKEIKLQFDTDMKVDSAAQASEIEVDNHDVLTQSPPDVDEQLPTPSLDIPGDDCCEPESGMDIMGPDDIFYEVDKTLKRHVIEVAVSDEQVEVIYNRIFSSIISKIDEYQKGQLHTNFVSRLNGMLEEDVKILSMNIDDINDSSTYFKQSALDMKLLGLSEGIISQEQSGNPAI